GGRGCFPRRRRREFHHRSHAVGGRRGVRRPVLGPATGEGLDGRRRFPVFPTGGEDVHHRRTIGAGFGGVRHPAGNGVGLPHPELARLTGNRHRHRTTLHKP